MAKKKPIYLMLGAGLWLMALYNYFVESSQPPGARWLWLFDLASSLGGVHGYAIFQSILGTAFLCAAWFSKE